MNTGIYRLVFNAARGIWMVVSEHVVSHQAGAMTSRVMRRKKMRAQRRDQKSIVTISLLLLGVSLSQFSTAVLAVEPHVVPTGLSVGHGNVHIHTPEVHPENSAGQLLKIDQASLKGLLRGDNFNIGRASEVRFSHTAGEGSSTLIKITGPKSVIEGALNAPNGKIYLINQNGILFGDGARINVGALTASGLDLLDSDYLSDFEDLNAVNRFGSATREAAYVWNNSEGDITEVLVQVDPGAEIKAAFGGSVMLFAPQVVNKGSITTADGQVVMAAGEKVYLSYVPDLNGGSNNSIVRSYASDSPYNALAGVLVEVDAHKSTDNTLTSEVTNTDQGRILAQRGNVTLAGYIVNQEGRITATSSVSQKGSIRLLARHGGDSGVGNDGALEIYNEVSGEVTGENLATLGVAETLILGDETGELNVGEDSVTAVLPEDEAAVSKVDELFAVKDAYTANVKSALAVTLDADGNPVQRATITDGQKFNPNLIEAVGNRVYIGDNAKLVNPAGDIKITASPSINTLAINLSSNKDESRVYLGKNSLVDASGLKNVEVDMESNFVELLLTQLDLKDNPLNRDGFINREKVWLDIRNAPDARVADLAGFVSQAARSLGGKHATGGDVTIVSNGSVIQDAGATVDVSGGTLKYLDGINKETWLVDASNNAYALGDAPADVIFTGFYGGSNTRNLSETGYTSGQQAGKISVQSHRLAADGAFKGNATYGTQQREVNGLGGELNIELLSPDVTDVNITNSQTTRDRVVNSLDPDVSEDSIHNLNKEMLTAEEVDAVAISSAMLNQSGLEKISIDSKSEITVNGQLDLAQGASLSLSGRKVNVNNSITTSGGEINLTAAETQAVLQQNDINIADNVTLDVSGNWTNDQLSAAQSRIVNDAGSITLSADDNIAIGNGALLDASAGAQLKTTGDLVAGDGGHIALNALQNQDGNAGRPFTYDAIDLNGELRAFSLAGGQGGHLSLTAPFVTIGQESYGGVRELLLTPDFFQQGGFSTFNIVGRDGVVVRQGAAVDVASQNYVLGSDYKARANSNSLFNFASTQFLPSYLQGSTAISLTTMQTSGVANGYPEIGFTQGSVFVEKDATIKVTSNSVLNDAEGVEIAPTITLGAWDNQLYVDGTLEALGGDIKLVMNGISSSGSADDKGYNAAQTIWLGNNSRLLAGAYTSLQPSEFGYRQGEVYDAGNVSLIADRGYVVTEKGSLIDVSGTSATLDVRSLTGLFSPKVVNANAGQVLLHAREGMLVDGAFNATSPNGLGGKLEVRLSRDGNNSPIPLFSPLTKYPSSEPWVIALSQSGNSIENLSLGDDVGVLAESTAHVSADNIMQSGFSDVLLNAESQVKFVGDVQLATNRRIQINSQQLVVSEDATVSIDAPVVDLQNTNSGLLAADRQIRGFTTAATPEAGSASLNVNAELINIEGEYTLSGIANAAFVSQGDIRLHGYTTNRLEGPVGSLNTDGLLSMTASQIYPTTLSQFVVEAVGDNSAITVKGNGDHQAVLSAQGDLTLKADKINQSGVIKAPFGAITLEADTLNLEDGSLTSVSSEGALIPFGMTDREGLDYIYEVSQLVSYASLYRPTADAVDSPITPFTDFFDKGVSLQANQINQAEGSQVDISGGGDLFAYEWVPGIGGSADALAADANANIFGENAVKTWAIVPAGEQTFASYDAQYWQGSDLTIGQSIYLSGGSGVAEGYYTLMPARYALVEGSKLVTMVNNAQDLPVGANQSLLGGGELMAGYTATYTADGYKQTSRQAGFVVRDGSYANQLAEYKTTLASDYFAQNTQVLQTADAGRLSIQAGQGLTLNGIVNAVVGDGGAGSQVDLSADQILIVEDSQAEGEVTRDGETYLAVKESSLVNLNASSLLLGGNRDQGKLSVASTEVRVDQGATIESAEVILAAKDSVQVDEGATVRGEGLGASANDFTITDANNDGDSAFLRVSGGESVQYARENANNDRGELILNSGATIAAEGSVQFDAAQKLVIDSEFDLGEGAAVDLVSSRISLGTPQGGEIVTNGLSLNQAQLNAIANAGDVSLTSASTIDFYGDVKLGGEASNISLNTAGLAGYQNNNETATINANQLRVDNQYNASFLPAEALSLGTSPSLGDGGLQINTNTLIVGDNNVRIAGYDSVEVNATEKVSIEGNSDVNALIVDNNLSINTASLTAATNSSGDIIAENGALTLSGLSHSAGADQGNSEIASSNGAELALTAKEIVLSSSSNGADAAVINLQGGNVRLTATGDGSTDNVTIGTGASIDVSGTEALVDGQSIDTPAGGIALTADNGSVVLEDAAKLSLDGNGGALHVNANNGEVVLAGNVVAGENSQASVDAAETDFSQTASALNDFNGVQTYRVRQGDVNVSADQLIVAKNVTIGVDNGNLTIDGVIDASGKKGGQINLYADGNIELSQTAQLVAKGQGDKVYTAGTLGDGGDIILSSLTGEINVVSPNALGEGGALIDVTADQAGEQKGRGGTVTYRVDADNIANVIVTSTAAVTGARESGVNITPVFVSETNTLNQAQLEGIESDIATVSNNFESLNYATTRDGVAVTVTPEALVKSDGDLTVSGLLTMNDRYHLHLSALGDVKLNAGSGSVNAGGINAVGSNGGSVSIVAGVDNASANPYTVNNGTGDVVLEGFNSVRLGRVITKTSNAFIRTDSGNINIAAGANIDFSNDDLGASAYSKGIDSADPVGFDRLANASTGLIEYYGENGGDVSLTAGGSVLGAESVANEQSTNNWLITSINNNYLSDADYANKQARWWMQDTLTQSSTVASSDLIGFVGGAGTFGGGDVTVEAQGSVEHFQVAAATNGRMGGDPVEAASIENFLELGGGDVRLIAGADVVNTMVQSGYGNAEIKSNGSVEQLTLSLMQSDVKVDAGGDVSVADVYNTTAIRPAFNTSSRDLGHSFYTYSDLSGVSLLSASSNVSVDGQNKAAPSAFAALAPFGDVNLSTNGATNELVLFSNNQEVNVVSGQDVKIGRLIQSDADAALLPNVLTDTRVDVASNTTLASLTGLSEFIGPSAHKEDLYTGNAAVNVVAGKDVVFTASDTPLLATAQQLNLSAGNDVVNPNILIQNIKESDVSVIKAGRDIVYDAPTRSGNVLVASNNRIEVGGPGRLNIIAGRDVDLQASRGILSVGNVNNPFLSNAGADLMVQAGASGQTDYEAVIANYIEPGATYSSVYLPALTEYMQQLLADNSINAEQALELFKTLDSKQQSEFIVNKVFFPEIKAGGQDASNPESQYGLDDYTRAERMILTMFPEFTQNPEKIPETGSLKGIFEAIANESISNPGDIKLFYSQIRSERGGDIELLAPGGDINAGLAVSSGLAKQDGDLGILSLRGGDINTLVRNDLQVNQSRVFTLGGSDLLLYSALEDIDAGKGEKTASATPPPTIRIVNGRVVLDYSAAVSGSGIAALTSTGGESGDVSLFAPYGTIDAGEAGIRSTGDVFIGARVVVGGDNISAGGTTTGVSVSTASFSISVPSAAGASGGNNDDGDSSSETAKTSANQKLAALPSIISVEVLSLGDGSSTGFDDEN